MKAEYINPFLEAATGVIEQVIQVRPSTGQLAIQEMVFAKNYTWILIGLNGQLQGEIVFGLSDHVAMHLVSAMMGGYVIHEVDEMARSAISELGNMISGNASTLFYNVGIHVDITPPIVVEEVSWIAQYASKRALTIPLMMEGIGDLDLQVIIAS
ncbi:chemotaxis protein CheX [Paenibacillus yanchengensis]|uniref:Chemotaxis protein CheX n=1 Tax=Paenibacillus yanchengensis TaxID=2035833 RepID=A0ABW4YLK9_9BACL